MKFIIYIIVLILLSVFILHIDLIYASTFTSPIKQISNGIKFTDIKCNEGLKLVIKYSDGKPACIKHSSIKKLFERNWAIKFSYDFERKSEAVSPFSLEKKVISFEFENGTKNNFDTVCQSKCDGILVGTGEFVDSLFGNAIKFDGNGWVEILLPDEMNTGYENGISISFWVMINTHEKGDHNMIYNKGSVGWGSYYAKSISGYYYADEKVFRALWQGDNQNEYINVACNDSHDINLNEWYHIVHVLDKDKRTFHQFINGKIQCGGVAKAPLDSITDDVLYLGRVAGTYDLKSHLTLDNFSIYPYALSEKEVRVIFDTFTQLIN